MVSNQVNLGPGILRNMEPSAPPSVSDMATGLKVCSKVSVACEVDLPDLVHTFPTARLAFTDLRIHRSNSGAINAELGFKTRDFAATLHAA